jgi:hypothetical protein
MRRALLAQRERPGKIRRQPGNPCRTSVGDPDGTKPHESIGFFTLARHLKHHSHAMHAKRDNCVHHARADPTPSSTLPAPSAQRPARAAPATTMVRVSPTVWRMSAPKGLRRPTTPGAARASAPTPPARIATKHNVPTRPARLMTAFRKPRATMRQPHQTRTPQRPMHPLARASRTTQVLMKSCLPKSRRRPTFLMRYQALWPRQPKPSRTISQVQPPAWSGNRPKPSSSLRQRACSNPNRAPWPAGSQKLPPGILCTPGRSVYGQWSSRRCAWQPLEQACLADQFAGAQWRRC